MHSPRAADYHTSDLTFGGVQGAKIVDQLDTSSSCDPYFSQSQHLHKAMLDKLEHMHEFLTDYMRHTTIEQ